MPKFENNPIKFNDKEKDIDETVKQIRKSMNYGESKIPYSVFLLGAVLLGVVVAMILADMPAGIN